MSDREMHFANMSRYPKTCGTPLDVIEQVKRERGYIDLDDPEQRRKYVSSDSRVSHSPRASIERTEGIKRAKIEHKQALKNLKQGTAKTRVKKTVGRPKTATEMPTAKGQEVLEILRDKGFYDVSDWSLSQVYLSNIIGQVRELGRTVDVIKGKNRRVVRYVMDEQ